MSASILGCGHASQLFEVNYLGDTPQVHLHFLTSDEEYATQGFGVMEMVCHGCGTAILVTYDDSVGRRKNMTIRNRFRSQHRACPDHGYKNWCPDYRSCITALDLRKSKRTAAPTQKVA